MRKSPCTPLRVKAKGKEISRDVICSTGYRGRAGVTCAGARRGVAALVAAAVEEALTAFGGTRGPKPSDETLWAAIAWRIGAENFHHAVIEKISENHADGLPRNPAAAFQRFLDRRFPKRPVDAKSVRVPVDAKSVRVETVDAKSVRVGERTDSSLFDAERIPRLRGRDENIASTGGAK